MAPWLTEELMSKKDLGQHFLVDHTICDRIVHFAGISSNDTVFEIGPGTGRLTDRLLNVASQVIGIEVDQNLIPFLQNRWSGSLAKKFCVVQGDILKVHLKKILPHRGVHLIANLPYNIATPIIKKMTESSDWFHSLTVMVQSEVASRILAPCNNRNYGYFSLFSQFHHQLEKGFQVPPEAFSPRPSVNSTVIKMTPFSRNQHKTSWNKLHPFLSCAFRHPRKTLLNNLRSLDITDKQLKKTMTACGIDRHQRPHQISLEEFCCLVQML